MKSLILSILLLCISPIASGAVSTNNILLTKNQNPGFGADYTLTVFQDFAGTNPTSIFFNFTGSQLIFVTSNIDEGSDWYLGAAGVIFSASRIANGEFGLFVRSDFSGATINPITTTGASFYLCVNTGTGFSATGPNREIFGWAELKSDGSTLSLSSSAVSYTMPGIIIGTTTAVPEPASAGLFFSIASVFVALASKRRRKCPQ